jgi:hypothetical protein
MDHHSGRCGSDPRLEQLHRAVVVAGLEALIVPDTPVPERVVLGDAYVSTCSAASESGLHSGLSEPSPSMPGHTNHQSASDLAFSFATLVVGLKVVRATPLSRMSRAAPQELPASPGGAARSCNVRMASDRHRRNLLAPLASPVADESKLAVDVHAQSPVIPVVARIYITPVTVAIPCPRFSSCELCHCHDPDNFFSAGDKINLVCTSAVVHGILHLFQRHGGST